MAVYNSAPSVPAAEKDEALGASGGPAWLTFLLLPRPLSLDWVSPVTGLGSLPCSDQVSAVSVSPQEDTAVEGRQQGLRLPLLNAVIHAPLWSRWQAKLHVGATETSLSSTRPVSDTQSHSSYSPGQ